MPRCFVLIKGETPTDRCVLLTGSEEAGGDDKTGAASRATTSGDETQGGGGEGSTRLAPRGAVCAVWEFHLRQPKFESCAVILNLAELCSLLIVSFRSAVQMSTWL